MESYLQKLDEARHAYEQDHPDWRLQSLFWILERGLGGLRNLLESDVKHVTWEHPFVQLRFPVECQWTATPKETPFVVTSGKIPEANLNDDELMVDTLAKIMVCQLEIQTLQDLTNQAVYVRDGESHRTMFSSEDVERLEAIASEEERNKEVRNLLRPCSFGGGTIELPSEIEEGDAIPDWTATQLSEIKPPLLMVSTPVGTDVGRVAVIFEIHPMVADIREQAAYFPLTIGLTLFTEPSGDKPQENPAPGWLKFAGWSEEQRQRLWSTLFAAIAEHLSQLGPAVPTAIESAVLTINAQIQIRANPTETFDEIRQRALAELQQMGTVVAFDSKVGSEANPFPRAEAFATLRRVELEQRPDEKGKALEELMAMLFGGIDGFRVSRRVRTETEEIDLVIVNLGAIQEFRGEGQIILVECKNWSGNCGKKEFVLLQSKMANRGERCTLGFLISWNGFAETITKEMLRSSREKLLIVPLDGNQIKVAMNTDTFLNCITKAWEEALLV